MKNNPDEIIMRHLEVVVMPNGEIICMGKTVGWVSEMGKYLSEPENNKDEISIKWCVEDVKGMEGYEDLTDEEARQVLQFAQSEHDAEVGINWEVLEYWADKVREARHD